MVTSMWRTLPRLHEISCDDDAHDDFGRIMTAPSDEPDRTGNARVDAAIERLRELDAAPIDAHASVYEAVHEELRAALAAAGAEDSSGSSQ